MNNEVILIVDDELRIRQSLSGVLEDEGYQTLSAENGETALRMLETQLPDLVLLDIWMPGEDGITVLQKMKEQFPNVEIIMISGHGNIELAVKATKCGAFDFLEKPLSLEKVLLQIRNALDISHLKRENALLRAELHSKYQIIGQSSCINELQLLIKRAGPTNGRVLISGESGTGKELIARSIHACSNRRMNSFIEINCAAIPDELIESELFGYEKGAFTGALSVKKGKFELAQHGTLFMDEIGDMSLKTQAKVLRALEEQKIERIGGNDSIPIDTRVIAASNKDLNELIRSGLFREDLFYRLNVIPIFAPPLRLHKEDIPLLVEHFLASFAEEYGQKQKQIAPEALDVFMNYDWPGNIRELKNVIERLVIMTPGQIILCDDIELSTGQPELNGVSSQSQSLKKARDEFERQLIYEQLRLHEWNIARTAEILGTERSNLYKKMKIYGIVPPAITD